MFVCVDVSTHVIHRSTCVILFFLFILGILDAQGPAAVPGLSEPQQTPNRRGIIVADDFTASQTSDSKNSGGGGGCCG